MKKKSFILIFFLGIFFLGINLVSSADDCVTGSYNVTHFCNLNGNFESLRLENANCLNNYECLNGACTFNATVGKTICEPTYKAIREQTKFLQAFFDRLIVFFTGEEFRKFQIEFVNPTTLNSGAQGFIQDYVEANVSALSFSSVQTPLNLTIYLYNSEGLLYKNEVPFSEVSLLNFANFTELPRDKTYYLNASIIDSSSGEILISTETRRILLSSADIWPPIITINNPQPNEDYESLNINFEYDVDEFYPDSCWYSLDNGVTNSTPDLTCSVFNELTAKDGLNTWTIYAMDSFGNIGSKKVTFTVTTPDSIPPEVILFIHPSENLYYPDSIISFGANVSDNKKGKLEWEIISDVSGAVSNGNLEVNADTEKSFSSTFSLPPSLSGTEQEHILTFKIKDLFGNFNDDSTFALTLKNENCTDGIDNDADKILDVLDLDCADGTNGISMIDLQSANNVLEYRSMNAVCKYSSDLEDINSLKKCVKLNLSGNICEDGEVNLGEDRVRFSCDAGRSKLNTPLTCYLSPDCNIEVAEFSKNINITKFDICDYGNVGRENISLNLNDPSNSNRFDNGDTLEFDLNVFNEYDETNSLDLVAEVWLYDIDEEKILLNETSNPLEIDFLEEDNFLLDLNLPRGIDYGDNLRLYYKVYKNNDEDFICRSESVRIYVNSRNCVDTDHDDYCFANDCNDSNSNINPGVTEICTDNIDNNCNGKIDGNDPSCIISDSTSVGPGETIDIGVPSSTGDRILMSATAQINLNLNSVSHSIFVSNILENSVILTVSSNPFNVSLNSSQTKDVDANQDGANDLRLILNGIVNGKADLTIRGIFQSTGFVTSTPEFPAPEEGRNSFKTVLIVLIFLIFLVGGVLFLIIYFGKKKFLPNVIQRPAIHPPFRSHLR